MALTRLELVDEPEPAPTPTAPDAVSYVKLGLAVLSQRALNMALAFIGLSLGFVLSWSVRNNPNVYQIVLIGAYYVFCLTMIYLRRT